MDVTNIKINDKLEVERHPIYESNDAPAYRVTVKTIKSIESTTDKYVLIRFKGVKGFYRLSSSGWLHGSKTRYVVLTVNGIDAGVPAL